MNTENTIRRKLIKIAVKDVKTGRYYVAAALIRRNSTRY